MDPDDPAAAIRQRTKARSGKSSYGDTVVIRDGTTTYLDVILHYIPHTDRDEVCPKLRYWKKAAGAYRTGFPAEFTLNESETRHLIRVLQDGLSVAQARDEGRYMTVRLDGSATDLTGHDPREVGKALQPIISDPRVVQALATLPDVQRILDRLEYAVRVTELQAAIDTLEAALAANVADEAYYQRWIEDHCWIFGNAYAMRDEVRKIALGDQVDMLLAATANGYRDIIELKRPDHGIIGYDASHKSYYWLSDTAKAIGQCHRYIDALHEAAARGLRDYPQIVAHYPRAIIIVGRSAKWDNDYHRALHGLNSRLHGITIMTYDQMLAQGHQLLDTLRGTAAD